MYLLILTFLPSDKAAGEYVDIREEIEDDSIETKGNWFKINMSWNTSKQNTLYVGLNKLLHFTMSFT